MHPGPPDHAPFQKIARCKTSFHDKNFYLIFDNFLFGFELNLTILHYGLDTINLLAKSLIIVPYEFLTILPCGLRQFSSGNDLTIFCFPIINQKILYKLSLDLMMTLDIFDLFQNKAWKSPLFSVEVRSLSIKGSVFFA